MDIGMDLRNIRVGGTVNIKRSDGKKEGYNVVK